MKIVLTLLVRDEIDIIQNMLDFHLKQGIDQIIITDNGSVDGTLEICKEFAKRSNVELLTEAPSDFSQHRWVTKMANLAYEKYHADWVIHADTDELFLQEWQYKNLRDFFTKIPERISIIKVPRTDFIPFRRDNQESPFIEMLYRKRLSLNLKGNPLPPKIIHRGSPNVIISQGNHSVQGDWLNEIDKTNGLMVYHYPIRSYKQFYSKVYNGGSGYKINKELPIGNGFHKRYWYDLLLKGKLEDLYYKSYEYDSKKLRKGIKNKDIIEDHRIEAIFERKKKVN